MPKIRVLVVEDSLTVRSYLVDILTADPDFEVVGEVGNGKAAIEALEKSRPDVITMDMMMPVMTGLSATEYIMAHRPTPILVVSASTNRGELFRTYDALAAGAVDVLEKPKGNEAEGAWEKNFLSTLKLVSRIKVITHPRGRMKSYDVDISAPAPAIQLPRDGTMGYEVLAIGASTGGPGAIVALLQGLPESFKLPILFVMHINEPFGTAFADWLDAQTSRRVAHAEEGQLVSDLAGRVAMAPGHSHIVVKDGRIRLNKGPERHSCRPSVDVLFESVAHAYGPRAAACLLTGMGRDGAEGLLDIRKRGGLTIAQDEASSVIFGMPREAILLGAAKHVFSISAMGPMVARLTAATAVRSAS